MRGAARLCRKRSLGVLGGFERVCGIGDYHPSGHLCLDQHLTPPFISKFSNTGDEGDVDAIGEMIVCEVCRRVRLPEAPQNFRNKSGVLL